MERRPKGCDCRAELRGGSQRLRRRPPTWIVVDAVICIAARRSPASLRGRNDDGASIRSGAVVAASVEGSARGKKRPRVLPDDERPPIEVEIGGASI